MARLRLRTQLLIANLLIICGLTASVLFIVRQTVRSEIADQLRQSTNASLTTFESVRQQHELELSRTAALLAQLPSLKALMTTQDALTIQDASEPFWKLAGSDLFLLASPARRVMGFYVGKPGWSPSLAERNLAKSLELGEDSAWWYANDQLYWVFLRPITAGYGKDQRELGVLVVGYQVDSSLARQLAAVSSSQIALTADHKVIASTLTPLEQAQMERLLAAQDLQPAAAAREMVLGNAQFQAASLLVHGGPSTPITCYVLVSLQRSNYFLGRLNRIVFLLGASALVLAAVLLSWVSRTITQPLENLVAAVRALAVGDYAYSITRHGSSEVLELGESFAKMRDDLLLLQQRSLAAERIAALGRAATSISHDLRHYLAAVVANAEFLYEAERLRMDRDEIYEEIKSASNQMIDLLDSLRELAREGPAISPVPASMDQAVQRALDTIEASPAFRNRSISLISSGPMNGVFDPGKMERACLNLLCNACEATVPVFGRIEVEIVASQESFDIRIIDNGPGIPASIQKTLFDPFVSFGKPHGTGLGLAIVSKIVHDHHGWICVEKTSEAGTVFRAHIPRCANVVASPVLTVVS